MLAEIFYWLLNMSITASITGCCVLLLRNWKKLPRRAVFALWCIPLIRMWLPFGLDSRYGITQFTTQYFGRQVILFHHGGRPLLGAANHIGLAQSYFPVTFRVSEMELLFRNAALMWLAIGAGLLILFSVFYIRATREVNDAVHLRGNIYLSHRVRSPAVYGIFRPRIFVPKGCADQDLTYVQLHENAHIRRLDNLWRVVALVSVCVHWFNPLAWVFLKAFLADMELSCDEQVLRQCGEAQKKAYAAALVDSHESRNIFASAFGGAGLRQRVEYILSYKQMSILSTVFFTALLLSVACCLLTN